MGDTDVTVYYNIHRLEALKTALNGQGQSVQDAVSATLDSLYEKMVPEQVRRDIEDRIVKENAQAKAEAEAAMRYSVLWLKQGEDEFCLLDSEHLCIYSLARMYRTTLQPKLTEKSLWSVLGCFAKAERLLVHSYACMANQIGVNPQIKMVAEIDLDKGTLCYRDSSMDSFVGYSLRDLSTAIFRAERRSGLKQNIREDIFFNALDGKELEPTPAQVQEESEPVMQM